MEKDGRFKKDERLRKSGKGDREEDREIINEDGRLIRRKKGD